MKEKCQFKNVFIVATKMPTVFGNCLQFSLWHAFWKGISVSDCGILREVIYYILHIKKTIENVSYLAVIHFSVIVFLDFSLSENIGFTVF